MKRNVSLQEISDGKLYNSNDLVKANCNGCKGCSICCQGMGKSIVLDPMDTFYLKKSLSKNFAELMSYYIELNVVDGIILPNLKMVGEEEKCVFLNVESRCGIHLDRPGMCRLFPLGRYYENQNFQYFLQIHECPYPAKSKVKISKWLDRKELKKYELFIRDWHIFLNCVQDMMNLYQEDSMNKEINTYLLNQFYVDEFEENGDFYMQFFERLGEAINKIKLYKK